MVETESVTEKTKAHAVSGAGLRDLYVMRLVMRASVTRQLLGSVADGSVATLMPLPLVAA